MKITLTSVEREVVDCPHGGVEEGDDDDGEKSQVKNHLRKNPEEHKVKTKLWKKAEVKNNPSAFLSPIFTTWPSFFYTSLDFVK